MKIRRDFVTNSSSSSFILGFKSENDIQETLAQEERIYEYFDVVFEDCQEAEKMTMDEMLKVAREEMEWNVRFDIEYYSEKGKSMKWDERYEWTKTKEFEEMVESEIQKRLNEMKKKAEEDGDEVFVKVQYSDDLYGELEHYLVPTFKCCLRRFNHH